MKKILLFILLIPNLVMAETWVCISNSIKNNPIQDKDILSKYEREGKYFVQKSLNNRYKIDFENENKVYATMPVSDMSYWVLSLDKKRMIQQTLNIHSAAVYGWRGKCEIVE